MMACVLALAVLPGHAQTRSAGSPGLMMLAGSGSHIGVSARDIDQAEVARLKVSGGVVIDDVRPETPAARAGLQKSDVVVEFDGERVRSARQFSRLVQETPPGREVAIAVMRDGSRRELRVSPEARSAAGFLSERDRERMREAMERIGEIPFDLDVPGIMAGQRSRLGVSVQELTPQLATYFGAKDGLLVSAVTDGSAAARAGVKAGDVITSVNGRVISSAADLNRELRAAGVNTSVKLGIVRDKKETELTATIEAPVRRRTNRV